MSMTENYKNHLIGGDVTSMEKLTRAEKVKANYNNLRGLGFEVDEARKLRHKSQEEIDKAIKIFLEAHRERDKAEHTAPARAEQKGNPQRRVSPEEGNLLEVIRGAGLDASDVLEMVKDKLEQWVTMWHEREPGGIMERKLGKVLEGVRRV